MMNPPPAPMLLACLLLSACALAPPQDPEAAAIRVAELPDGGLRLQAGEAPLLVYRARQVPLPAGYLERVAEGNRRYARPRSGYLHPLYGLDGEELTLDWSLDHPHHRGIYWAWPELRWGERTGDLHALQEVWSRPVGEPSTRTDPATGAVVLAADNLWSWQDGSPVAFERVQITAHPPEEDGARAVDLALRFEALVDELSLARRGTDLYGGLNLRLAPVADLALDHHPPTVPMAWPSSAWSSATGTWRGGERRTTLAVIEHPANPDFPGDFVSYPELPWFQPAFPRAGTRYALRRGEPLLLRYRLRISPGEPDPGALADACLAFALLPDPFEAPPPANETEDR